MDRWVGCPPVGSAVERVGGGGGLRGTMACTRHNCTSVSGRGEGSAKAHRDAGEHIQGNYVVKSERTRVEGGGSGFHICVPLPSATSVGPPQPSRRHCLRARACACGGARAHTCAAGAVDWSGGGAARADSDWNLVRRRAECSGRPVPCAKGPAKSAARAQPPRPSAQGEYPHRARTVGAPRAHRVRYLNNFSRRWSTGRGVVDGTWWALRRYHSL